MEKVVFITGGSSGLGLAIGTYLTDKGYRVYGTSRNPQKLAQLPPFPLLTMDVRNKASIDGAIRSLLAKESRIDILVNNAGVGITGPVEETPAEQARNVFEINFHGPLEVMNAVLPVMRKQGEGLIINITSIAGYMGLPFRGYYSASKGALELISEALRMELKAFNIRCTTLAPGDFATNIASGRYHAPAAETSPYKDTYQKSLDLMNEHVDEGGDPKEVAEAVYKIIRKRDPKVHYRVGAPLQKFSLFLKGILPDKLFERMLRNHYKL